MQRMEDSSYLENINLNDKSIYFNRMKNMPANYYHWHQCVEILSVSQGVGIALMEHQQYTVKPGRIFIFPPGKLHKVFVEQDALLAGRYRPRDGLLARTCLTPLSRGNGRHHSGVSDDAPYPSGM